MPGPRSISVVIVTYNSRHLIDRCLAPFADQRGDIEVIVWDNASRDGTARYVADRYPWVRLLASAENLGFAGGNNAAFQHCSGQYVLLLNPDAFLTSWSTLTAMRELLDSAEDIAMVGPQLLNVDGSHQVGDGGWEITAISTVGHFLFLHRLCARFPAVYLTNRSLLRQRPIDVDWVSGACMLVRMSLVAQTGGMDSRIFMYGEDLEWCREIRASGYRVLYLPSTTVTHLQGGTQRDEHATFYSTKHLDHLFAVLNRRHDRRIVHLLRAVVATGFVLRAAASAISMVGIGSRAVPRLRNMWKYAKYSLSSNAAVSA